jgi:hypothetical protein
MIHLNIISMVVWYPFLKVSGGGPTAPFAGFLYMISTSPRLLQNKSTQMWQSPHRGLDRKLIWNAGLLSGTILSWGEWNVNFILWVRQSKMWDPIWRRGGDFRRPNMQNNPVSSRSLRSRLKLHYISGIPTAPPSPEHSPLLILPSIIAAFFSASPKRERVE